MQERIDGEFETLGLSKFIGDPRLADELIAAYIDVFNAEGEGEWHESWTPDAVRKKLFEETRHEAGKSMVVLWRVGGTIAGFGIVYVESPLRAFRVGDLPPGHQEERHLEAFRRNMAWVTDADLVCNFREVGIKKEFRKGVAPVMELFCRCFEAGESRGATFCAWWTSKKSKVYPIVMGLDARTLYEFFDPQEHVLLGEETRFALRRMRHPAMVVSSMLGERLKHRRLLP